MRGHAKTIARKEPKSILQVGEQIQEVERPERQLGAVDAILKAAWHYRRYTHPALKEAFPTEPGLWLVDRWYSAQGVAIDEPQNDAQMAECAKKKTAMVTAGVRYVVKHRNMALSDLRRELEG